MEQTVIWPCTEEITASSRTVERSRKQECMVYPTKLNRSNCAAETLPLFSLTEQRLVAHTPSVKADLFGVQQSAVWCSGSLYCKCHFLQGRSDVIKTDQTAQAQHIRGRTHVPHVRMCAHTMQLFTCVQMLEYVWTCTQQRNRCAVLFIHWT